MVECSNCHVAGLVWSEGVRLKPDGKYKHWLIDPNAGIDHECYPGHKNEKDIHVKNTQQRGMPCLNKCGTFVARDQTLPDVIRLNATSNRPMNPEPKLREVLKRLDSQGRTIFDLNSGEHHTRYRCMMLREGYSDRQVKEMERSYYEKHAWYLASLASMFNPPKYG